MAKSETKRRPKGEGSITTLPNGNLKMTITLGVGPDGKQKRKSVTAPTKALLMDAVAKLRVQSGLQPGARVIPKFFKDMVEQWLEFKSETVAYNTYANYKVADNKIFCKFYDYKVDKITPAMIDTELKAVRIRGGKKPSDSYLLMLKRNLGVVFNYIVSQGFLNSSPLRGTVRLSKSTEKVDLVIPTDDELKAILNNVKKYDSDNQKDVKTKGRLLLYPLFLLAVASGARAGELLGLTKRRIEYDKDTIDICFQTTQEGFKKDLKTKSSYRRIFINHDVLEVISKVPSDCEYVFTSNGHMVTYPAAMQQISRYLLGDKDVPEGFTMHSFRHYHATTLLKNGIGVKEVSKRLGHKSIKTTLDLYAHWLPEMDNKAANVIDSTYL